MTTPPMLDLPRRRGSRRARLLPGAALCAAAFTPALADAACVATGSATLSNCTDTLITANATDGTSGLAITDATSEKIVFGATGTTSSTQTLTIDSTTISSTAAGESAVNMNSPTGVDRNVTLTIGKDVTLSSTALSGTGGVWVRNEISGDISITTAATITDTTGYGIHAITNLGSVSIVNSGSVTSTTERGIYADGGFNNLSSDPAVVSVTNSGTVSAYQAGIRTINYMGLSSITNSGAVTSTTRQGLVAWSQQGNAEVTNSGSVTSNNDHAIQVATDAGDIAVTNSASGVVRATGGAGIYAEATGGSTTVVNAGSVSTSSNNTYGIYVDGTSSSVTNSGSVSALGSGSYAIYFAGSGNTLSLLDTASLQGGAADLYLGTGTDVRVDVNHSVLWTYDGTLSSLTSTGTSLAVDTGSAITVANTADVAQGSAIEAVRGMAVSNMLSRVAQQATAPTTRVASAGPVELPPPPEWTAWTMGYGEKSQRGSSDTTHFSNTLWGVAVGLDRHLDDEGTTAGLFVGRDETRNEFSSGTQRVKSRNVYLGLRAGSDDNVGFFWNGAAMGGIGKVSSRRQIDGAADPSRYSTDMQFGDVTGGFGYHQILGTGFGATYSGRVNYGIRHVDGYSENLAGTEMNVDGRVTQSVGGRLQASLDFWGAERRWQVSPHIGIEGWRSIGSDGTDVRFGAVSNSIEDDTSSNIGFVTGLDASWRFEDGVKLSAIADARRDRDGTTATQGFLQLSVPF